MSGQENGNDPIIGTLFERLGISPDDPTTDLPPLDAVHGYYQELGKNRFRLWLGNFSCFMQHFTERILIRSASPHVPDGTMLVLKADGDYLGELVIVCPGAEAEEEQTGGSNQESYALRSAEFSYVTKETTPWHFR